MKSILFLFVALDLTICLIPLRPLRAIAGAIEERRQKRRESEDNTMSIFKKSGEGFLAKLFKHKQVEELAEELAHTYAE